MKMSLLFNNSIIELLNNNYFLIKQCPERGTEGPDDGSRRSRRWVPEVPTMGPGSPENRSRGVPCSEKLDLPDKKPSGLCWTLRDPPGLPQTPLVTPRDCPRVPTRVPSKGPVSGSLVVKSSTYPKGTLRDLTEGRFLVH